MRVFRSVAPPFVYARFHGATKYSGRYDDGTLDRWADCLAEHVGQRRAVFAYFNNDGRGPAPRDAGRLREKLMLRVGEFVADAPHRQEEAWATR
jgi:uncharacterized protein YecE (DUF72 family)